MESDTYQPQHYLPQMRRGSWGELKHHEQQLRDVVSRLAFTPIIGPECATDGRSRSPGWDRIADTMHCVLMDELLAEAEEEQYLRAIAATAGVDIDALPAVSVPPHPDLHDLRIRLTRFAYKTGSVFGSVMSDTALAVTNITESYVQSIREREWEELKEYAIRACVTAQRLRRMKSKDPGSVPVEFDAAGVYQRLSEVVDRVVSSSLTPIRRRRLQQRTDEDVETVLRDLRVPMDETMQQTSAGTLYLRDVDWLAELVWYTFRFDFHGPLTNRELAFQFALEVSEANRIHDLASITELLGGRVLERLAKWFAAPRVPEGSGAARFFDAIAVLLMKQYDSAKAGRGRPGGVAIMTTFDTSLEDALEAAGASRYSVVFPLRCEPSHTRDAPYLRWAGACKDVASGRVSWAWIPDPGFTIPPPGLDGPVIVRLNGAPLQPLPREGDLPLPADEEITHAITISESGYLEHVVLLNALPSFVAKVLQEGSRSLFFLGHPIEDWNVKLRLHEHVFPVRTARSDRLGDMRTDRLMVAINGRIDQYGSSVLDALGIDRWEGELGRVADIIHEVLPRGGE